jgi:CRP-like cAMP-binding protein
MKLPNFRYAAGEDDNADSDYDVHYGHASGPGPAEEYLDEEELSERGSDSAKKWITPELSHLLNSFHMFGHMFDKAVFLELCKSIVAVPVPSGQYLFRAGDPDDCIYVVQSGRVNVHISDSENRTTTIKACGPGETVSSLLSFVDVLTGHDSVYRTVCCRAVEDSVVIKLPAAAFKDVFGKNPEMQIRVIQLIMARVQRVIFVALHQYLGLTSELVRQGSDYVAVSNAAGSASVAVSSQESLGDALDAIDGVGHDSLMNRAVSGFQAELDIDNADFLRDR